MTRKLKMINNIAANFISNRPPKIEGETNYEATSKTMQILFANAATLPTP